MRRILLLASLAATVSCQTPDPGYPFLQTIVQAARDDAPALGAVVVRCAGGMALAQDGVARIDTGVALADDARFNIGSNAKSMLASLAATFVRDRLLSWDTTIEDVLAVEAATLHPSLRQATLEQLLSHRSGAPAFSSGAELSSVEVQGETASAQRLHFALQVLRAPPAQEPGSGFLYSNAGYVIAGVLLERVGGKPFEDLMRERLFSPLGMGSANFGAPSPSDEGQPIGHFTREGAQAVYLEAEPAIPAFLQPAGDVSLTLEDYGRYLREHLCGLQGAGTRVLSYEAIQHLHEPIGESGGALGWGRHAFDGSPASIHVGGTGAFSAFVAVLPSRDLAIATVTNSGANSARQEALALLQSIISENVGQEPMSR